jgi:hypothetical protein
MTDEEIAELKATKEEYLLTIMRLTNENADLRDIARRVTELPYFKNARIEALVHDAQDALSDTRPDRGGEQ